MKGKVSFYFNAPNTSKVRSRITKPSEDFTKKLRNAINEAVIEVINKNTLELRAKLVEKFAAMGETMKDAKAAAQVTSHLNPYFDVFASATPFSETEGEEVEEQGVNNPEEQVEEVEATEQVEETEADDFEL
jgi:hypothetical protein